MFGDPFNHFVPARLNAHHSIGNLSPADLFSLYSWQFPVRRSGASRPHFRSSKKPGSFSPPGILTLPLLFHLCPFDILVPQDHWPPLLWGLSISIDHHSSLDLVLSRLFLFSLDQNLPPLPPAPQKKPFVSWIIREKQFCIIHSLNSRRPVCIPGMILGAWNRAMNQTLCSAAACILIGHEAEETFKWLTVTS